MITFSSVEELELALIQAKEAHVDYEKNAGPDKDWPKWYAGFMARYAAWKHSTCSKESK